MNEYDNIVNSPKKASLLGYVGAALLGFTMQLILFYIMAGNTLYAILIALVYGLFIAILEFRCKEKNCKFGCQLNEFWLLVEALLIKKLDKQI